MLIFSFLLAVASPQARCAACAHVTELLSAKLEATRKELEGQKMSELAADKVQKAQTKRWLKNEYGVALRAAVEDEMEEVCMRDAIAVNPLVRVACNQLVEEAADTLPRAMLDADHGFCASVVGGGKCSDDAARQAAKAAYAVQVRTEVAPARGSEAERAGPGGLVARLVGSTVNAWVHNASASAHALVMLHSSAELDRTDTDLARMESDPEADAVASQFYALAAAANASRGASAVLRFGQMDVSANDAPADLTSLAASRMCAPVICPPVCLPICLSTYLPTYPPICLSLYSREAAQRVISLLSGPGSGKQPAWVYPISPTPWIPPCPTALGSIDHLPPYPPHPTTHAGILPYPQGRRRASGALDAARRLAPSATGGWRAPAARLAGGGGARPADADAGVVARRQGGRRAAGGGGG